MKFISILSKICFFTTMLLEPCASVIISRCDLAKGLFERGIPESQLNDWVCLAESESSRNTKKVSETNMNGSKDYGIFQVNSKYWCLGEVSIKVDCGIECSALLTDSLDPSTACAKVIYNRHGFDAWYGWQAKCKQKDISFYTAGCDL